MSRIATLTLMIAAATTFCAIEAKPEFPNRLPNGKNVPGVSALGHSDGTGASDKLNVFGKAFDKAGQKWTTALCQADSDGDGQTNGQELGDPCCEWTTGATPAFKTGVSHPGDASKTVDASVLANYSCATNGTSSSSTATTTAPSSSATGVTSSIGAIVVVAVVGTAWSATMY